MAPRPPAETSAAVATAYLPNDVIIDVPSEFPSTTDVTMSARSGGDTAAAFCQGR
jgi:hypothetical protein